MEILYPYNSISTYLVRGPFRNAVPYMISSTLPQPCLYLTELVRYYNEASQISPERSCCSMLQPDSQVKGTSWSTDVCFYAAKAFYQQSHSSAISHQKGTNGSTLIFNTEVEVLWTVKSQQSSSTNPLVVMEGHMNEAQSCMNYCPVIFFFLSCRVSVTVGWCGFSAVSIARRSS